MFNGNFSALEISGILVTFLGHLKTQRIPVNIPENEFLGITSSVGITTNRG